jgi:hypothetical protein
VGDGLGRSWPVVELTLGELGRVWLEPVDALAEDLSKQWWEMMEAYHPLGSGPLCGAQMRYLIGSEAGYLGGLSFSAGAWRLAARDGWIGWDEERRKAGLSKVVANSRFLILPTVKVANLASHVLGLAVRRLARDWQARYGEAPALVETFVDRARHRGTCYRAANWRCLGQTQGRGRQDRKRTADGGIKDIWVYPLVRDCQESLRSGCASRRIGIRRAAADWAEEEFGGCQLSDARLKERLLTVARDFYARPTASVPQACSSRAKTKAAYRFLDHEETTMERLLEPHYLATEERVKKESVVLAVQDTTSLNYTAHRATVGLGPIGSKLKGSQGLHVHDTLAFNLEGTPLGFLNVQCWARDPKETGKKEARRKLPIDQRESGKWLKSYRAIAEVQARCPNTMLVSVGDREADIYELFREAAETPAGPKLLVRASHNRKLQHEQGRLWETVLAREVAGIQVVNVTRQGSRAAREAHLAIRFAAVSLLPTKRHKGAPTIPVWAVLAQEQDAPPGVKPLEWLLLTTLSVESFEQATEKLIWYARRWGIEVLHRTVKSGCRIEQRQLGQADRLEACLAIDMVVAWRIFHLSKLGREVPDAPCTIYFEESEWQALMVFTERNPIPPAEPPTIREAMHRVATLGGFQGRKGDGEPGTQSLWNGLQRLDDIAGIYRVMRDATQTTVSSRIDYG